MPPKMALQISYCPELGIYHYVVKDGDEYFFDDPKLEQTMILYMSQGRQDYAEAMALITAEARKHPHRILVRVDGVTVRIVDPVSHLSVDEVGVGGNSGTEE